jgi:hypothetical protein
VIWLISAGSRGVLGSVQEETEHKNEAIALPSNVVMPKDMKPILLRMIERSPTFRSQCQKIDSTPYLRIAIEIVPRLSDCQCRALSTVKRYTTGLVVIKVQIIVPSIHIVEVIGHEFEHALEQIEGLDLRALASTQSEYVYKADSGGFETKRAIRAGNVIEQEVYFFRNSNSRILTKSEGVSVGRP